MGVATDDYSRQIHAELVYDSIAKRLVRLCRWWRRGRADPEDLVQAALVRVLADDGSKWDRASGTTFFRHMADLIAKAAASERRRASSRRETADSEKAYDEEIAHPGVLQDAALEDARQDALIAKVQAEALAELDADDPDAAAMYRAIIREMDRSAMTQEFGWTAEWMHLAYDRLKNRLCKIADRHREAERQRMRAQRATFSNAETKGATE